MKNALLFLAVLSLLGVSLHLLQSNQPAKKLLEQTQTELNEAQILYKELEEKYQEVVTTMEQEKAIQAELDYHNEDQQGQLQKLQDEMYQIKLLIKEKQYTKARERIQRLGIQMK